MTTVGIVLAAGASRRFGDVDKLLAPFGGGPLAARAAAALTEVPGLDRRIAVVADDRVAAVFAGMEIAPARPGAEQSDSLRAGIEAARRAGATRAVIVLADMPNVGAELIAAVLARSLETGAAAAYDGHRRAPPVAFGANEFEGLLKVTGDRGARDLIAGLPEAALVPATPGQLADIDTPADLDALGATPPE